MQLVLQTWAIAVAALFILGTSGTAAEPAGVSGGPNPDPANIHSADEGRMLRVSPRNDADDYTNLQWAFDRAAPGGSIMLDAGTFYLGDGKASPRRTVLMRKGLRVMGIKDGSMWRTIIRGGGEVMTPGVGGPLESGPFRIVNETDPHPAVFEGIWFREWAAEVIFIEAAHGFVFRDNRISHPANRASPGIRFVHALWSSGSNARGDFTVEDCLVELGGYGDEEPADDEQFLGVFFSNHDNVRVINNTITGIDETIEILGNRSGNAGMATSPAEIIVTGNRVISTGMPGKVWPWSFAILIAGNLNVDVVRVTDNHVTKRGDGWAMGLSGENFQISGNTFRFEEQNGSYPPGAILIGGFGNLGPYELGNALNNSVFANNAFEGQVVENAIVFSPGRRRHVINSSHDNHFDFGDSVAGLGAETTLYLGKDTYHNTFKGKLGRIVDNAPEGANEYEQNANADQ